MSSIKSFAGNKCKISDLTLNMSQITDTNVFAVTAVSVIRKYENQKPTDEIDGIKYTVTDTTTLTQFTIKTSETKPVITQDDIDKNDNFVYIRVPEATITPYRIEYGKVSVSIVAPFVELVTDDEMLDLQF